MKFKVFIMMVIVGLLTLPTLAQQTATATVGYNDFSFSYDTSLASRIDIDVFAGDDPSLEQPGGPEVRHTQFAISNSESTPSIFDAPLAIRLYNTADFANYPNQQAELQQLQMLLDGRPDLSSYLTPTLDDASNTLPFLPIMPASQVIRARAQYVETAAVRGISYVTAYRQDVSPFVGSEFYYTFQGLSLDGTRYISLIAHPNTTLFPAEIPSDFNYDAFVASFTDYLNQSIAALNNGQAADFSPALSVFDAVVLSVNFGGGAVISPQAPIEATVVPEGDASLSGLGGVVWSLVSYGPVDAPIAPVPEVPVTLTFTQQGVSGTAGCNSYTGSFTYDVGRLSFGALATTQMACAEPVMTQESTFLAALQGATTFEIFEGQLRIGYPEGVLVFGGIAQPEPLPIPTSDAASSGSSFGGLAGMTWTLISYGAADNPVIARVDSPITAQFNEQGVSGSSGCNSYFGPFVYDAGTLTIGQLGSTLMACSEEVMQQEADYLTAFQTATSFQINGTQLVVTYAGGVLVYEGTAS